MGKMKIMVIGGHPADTYDNVGGMFLKHSRRGVKYYLRR